MNNDLNTNIQNNGAQPTPMPQAQPASAPRPMPQAQPASAPRPMPQAQPASAPRPMPQAQPAPAPRPMPQAQPAPAPRPMPQAQPASQTINPMEAVANLNKEEAMEEALSHTTQYSPFEIPIQEVNNEVKKNDNKGTFIFLGVVATIIILFIIFLPKIAQLLGW